MPKAKGNERPGSRQKIASKCSDRRPGASSNAHYRIYHVVEDGHISTPPEIIECADEQEAIGKAAKAANGKSVELWEGARLIVRFPQQEG